MPNDLKTELKKLTKKAKNRRTESEVARIAELRNLIINPPFEAPKTEEQAAKQDEAEAIVETAIETVAGMDDEEVAELLADPTPENVEAIITRRTIQSDCETAHEDGCTCRCRGKYHGQEHPKGWKDEEGCEPLNKTEKKLAKKEALYAWRRKNPERVSSYMKQWRIDKKNAEASEEAEEKGEGGE